MNCYKCRKPLSLEQSIRRGMGPVCAAKAEREARRLEEERGDKYDLDYDDATDDIVCRRDENGTLHFNIFPFFSHHSPTGWEWGYNGSGPADFAFNVLEMFCRRDEKPTVRLRDYSAPRGASGQTITRDIKVTRTAQRNYQTFKATFIATLPKRGGRISGDSIKKFIEEARKPYVPNYAALDEDEL